MTLDELLSLLKSVLVSPEVIGVTIVIALYINIVNYIVRYRKRLPQAKKRRRPRVSAAEESAEKAETESPRGGKRSSGEEAEDEA